MWWVGVWVGAVEGWGGVGVGVCVSVCRWLVCVCWGGGGVMVIDKWTFDWVGKGNALAPYRRNATIVLLSPYLIASWIAKGNDHRYESCKLPQQQTGVPSPRLAANTGSPLGWELSGVEPGTTRSFFPGNITIEGSHAFKEIIFKKIGKNIRLCHYNDVTYAS